MEQANIFWKHESIFAFCGNHKAIKIVTNRITKIYRKVFWEQDFMNNRIDEYLFSLVQVSAISARFIIRNISKIIVVFER